jgi:DNA-binding XRE family transcriptional regulator
MQWRVPYAGNLSGSPSCEDIFNDARDRLDKIPNKMKLLPEHIQGACGLLKMNRADLAKTAGVSELTVWHFETGKKVPRDETLWRIHTAF